MRIKQIKEQGEMTEAKARLIARLKGDGVICVSSKTNYLLKLECQDEELRKQFESDLASVYNLTTKRIMHRSGITGQLIEAVYVRSKLAYDDLMIYGPYRSYNWLIPNVIFNSSKEIKKEFIRTFADDEGTVVGAIIRIYSINKTGLEQLKKLIEEFNINCRITGGFGLKRNVFAIIISKKENVIHFRDSIGFSLKRKQEKLLKL